MTANDLKDNSNATVDVKGYASKDGSKAFNEKLAQKRADAVKKALVNKYGISTDRVNAEGQGIGELFDTNDWNRVAVMTVNK
jgi:outer membrane protein OmpA-like peptidoglycan-associated protein